MRRGGPGTDAGVLRTIMHLIAATLSLQPGPVSTSVPPPSVSLDAGHRSWHGCRFHVGNAGGVQVHPSLGSRTLATCKQRLVAGVFADCFVILCGQ